MNGDRSILQLMLLGIRYALQAESFVCLVDSG